jgi:acetolactate synthase small subunit
LGIGNAYLGFTERETLATRITAIVLGYDGVIERLFMVKERLVPPPKLPATPKPAVLANAIVGAFREAAATKVD